MLKFTGFFTQGKPEDWQSHQESSFGEDDPSNSAEVMLKSLPWLKMCIFVAETAFSALLCWSYDPSDVAFNPHDKKPLWKSTLSQPPGFLTILVQVVLRCPSTHVSNGPYNWQAVGQLLLLLVMMLLQQCFTYFLSELIAQWWVQLLVVQHHSYRRHRWAVYFNVSGF